LTFEGESIMANQQNPNDPYRPNRTDEDLRSPASLDTELQPDPELAEGPASGGRIALLAVAIAVVLGAVFYGLNNTSTNSAGNTAQTPSANQSTAQTSPPPVPPGVRDVTPHNNSASGVTTGAAPGQPQQPPAAMNRSANPPANNAPAAK
jgi:hypothetical protein